MTKGLITLYVERELIDLAKAKQINLSQFFNEILSIELEFSDIENVEDKGIVINKLKSRVSLLIAELKQLKQLNKKLEKENIELKDKIENDAKKHITQFETW